MFPMPPRRRGVCQAEGADLECHAPRLTCGKCCVYYSPHSMDPKKVAGQGHKFTGQCHKVSGRSLKDFAQ